MIHPDGAGDVEFSSSVLGKGSFPKDSVYPELENIPNGDKFDIVLISCESLQDFQGLGAKLAPYLLEDSVVVIESTGYVNLEPFMQMSLGKMKNIIVCSVMSENDVRQLGDRMFTHIQRNNDSRIYIGTCTNYSSKALSLKFQKVYKLFQLVQQDASGNITLLKSTKPKEFMTYQWKLALPRITFSPLCIFFELAFPENLSKQILCKPLISGIIGEIFKIIKKMDCKLVKGSENEANLLKGWSLAFPEVPAAQNEGFINSPLLFYQFYHTQPLCIDLLLLQPILLADDNGIRTPYLENLYSILCQLSKINYGLSDSIFFRNAKNSGPSKEEVTEYEDLKLKIGAMGEELVALGDRKEEIEIYLQDRQTFKNQIDNLINKEEANLKRLSMTVEREQQRLEELKYVQQREYERLQQMKHEDAKGHMVNATQNLKLDSVEEKAVANNGHGHGQSVRDSIQPSDNLADLADIAVYGSSIGHDDDQKIAEGSVNRSLDAMVPGEQMPSEISAPNGYNNQYQNQDEVYQPQGLNDATRPGAAAKVNGYQQGLYIDTQQRGFNNPAAGYQYGQQQQVNGYFPSPLDQQPPHGLPPSGLPQSALPYSLRGNQQNQYQPSNRPNYGSNGGGMPVNGYGPKYGQRVHSFSGSMNAYHDPIYQQNQYSSSQNFQYGLEQPPHDPRLRGPKKQNRRSNFSPMRGDFALDMGGRGGMPMPTGPGNAKARNSVAGGMRMSSPPTQRKSQLPVNNSYLLSQANGSSPGAYANGNPHPLTTQGQSSQSIPTASQLHLQIPEVSVNSSESSSHTGDTPQTTEENGNILIEAPVIDSTAKPLGSIASSNQKDGERKETKKKRGFFRRKG